MKTLRASRIGAVVLLFCAQITCAMAITFTHDAFISFVDLSHDGDDIVVTNCTLTVDGPHAFKSLQVLNGGVVTHSPLPYGPQDFTFLVSGEPQVPSSTLPATLNNTNVDSSTIEVMDLSETIFYTENVDYVVTFSNQFTQLTLTTNSAISEGATVLVNYDWAEEFQGFNLVISNDTQIAAGGAINVAGKGYAGGIGFLNGAGTSHATNFPFTFTAGGGAGHGGSGGMSSTFARGGAGYDSATSPGVLGSGGGMGSADGGTGGGVAALSIHGNLQVDGLLFADGLRGTNAHSGGGAGGSILISARGFSGAGMISAKGGSGDLPDGGGGGGGRIAIYFVTNTFTGNILAFGGGGSTAGGAGTIYLRSVANSAGQLFIVNGGKRGTNTIFAPDPITDLTISGGAIALPQITIVSVNNLYIGSNSSLIARDALPLIVTVIGNATLESNAQVNADSESLSGIGSGSAVCGAGSGGGYGGFGGASVCGARGGGVYGSIAQPSNLGSPGGLGSSGRGGGAITMTVGDTLTLGGKISANGGAATLPTSGGGSGGSVWLTVGTLLGGGAISANGGAASNPVSGGGSGGRIAVYFNTNLFAGSMTTTGGAGTNSGGPGTIYLKSGSDPIPQVIVDNGGLAGPTALPAALAVSDLTIGGGAILTNFLSSPINLRSLFIGSNSWLIPVFGTSLTGTITNAILQPNGGIAADGKFTTSSPSAGQSLSGTGGGGGNGGNGGTGGTNAAGGAGIGSYSSPNSPGGSGGAAFGPGGLGGGIINLTIPGSLQLNGLISANGTTGPTFNSGGGAGGSIRLSIHTISGTGTISANGGAANNLGGGGGGGVIALYSDTNSFGGAIIATGGSGANYGGAGIVYVSRSSLFNSAGQLTLDNGGNQGAKTPLAVGTDIDTLTVTRGAVMSNSVFGTLQFRNLLVGSNSSILAASLFNITSNATVSAGGSINSDGGAFSTPGMGQTLNSTGGGGGGAGSGGASALNAAGGIPVSDSLTSPISVGGSGGRGATLGNQLFGGGGGGNLRLTVGGTLRVDGRISSDGVTSSNLDSGGGGGGSVSLSSKTLAGSGIISANGGAGNSAGGGGGGGHIAVSYTTNLFTGNVTARGGSGANYGGAGIISFLGSPTGGLILSQLILDNGGTRGGYTPFFTIPQGNFNLTVTGGAILTNNAGFTVQNLLIGSNSTWLAFSSSSLLLTVQTNATIQTGGALMADGSSSFGPSPGQAPEGKGGGGGGHGGYGGTSISNALGGNITTDLISAPTGLGSVGGSQGGNGGGALQVTVRGALQLDGRISANGVTSSVSTSGGGSGGSVYLSVGKLSGAGLISVNGGAGNPVGGGGGGGGGGRIAIRYNTNLFTGSLTARGGAGANFGGAGTIYTTSSFQGEGKLTQIIVDNGGVRGTNTLLSSLVVGADLILSNGAAATLSSSATRWNSLTIFSNASLSLDPSIKNIGLTVASNLTIQSGGSIALDGQGFVANTGTGHGNFSLGIGSGAGHGGYGSLGSQPAALGGTSYELVTSPTQAGSGGGSLTEVPGSAGGGGLQLTVSGILSVNGSISANGTAGTVSGAGGGSGGSLWLSAGTFSGTGKISADGGDGELFAGGGGGGGGRIAISFNMNQFSGTLSAHGGAGPVLYGGAGTVYLKTNSSNVGQLTLDNSGPLGTNTPLASISPTPSSLVVRGGAAANSTAPLTVQNLLISPGGLFNANPITPLNLTVFGDALVQPGGAIIVDGAGYDPVSGFTNASVDFFGDGSGGGYGGAGGASLFGAPGGGTYGSSSQPVNFGSAGGTSPSLAGFSQGGGAMHLTVNRSLTINGTVSANGKDGFLDGSGGGSGGSIWISAQTFAGNGSLTANGGIGESGEGGGGGGGRIAIYTGTNFFAGNISATGGNGAFPGQNGTIYIPVSFLISGNVTNLNGLGIPGVTLAVSGSTPLTTDANGAYSVSVSPIWTGSITPAGNPFALPNVRTYSSLASDQLNQNFLLVSPSDLNLSSGQFDGTNVNFTWYGISGLKYQPYYSSNLVDWQPYGPVIFGGNAPASLSWPTTNAPQLYFRLTVTY